MHNADIADGRLLLALETSGDVCGIAALKEGRLLAETTFRHGMHLSERLMGMVQHLLEETGERRENIARLSSALAPDRSPERESE